MNWQELMLLMGIPYLIWLPLTLYRTYLAIRLKSRDMFLAALFQIIWCGTISAVLSVLARIIVELFL